MIEKNICTIFKKNLERKVTSSVTSEDETSGVCVCVFVCNILSAAWKN